MKLFYPIFILFFICSNAFSQDSAKRYQLTKTATNTMTRRLDTNEVFYDEQGKALHYYQYQKLINFGQYTIWRDPAPGAKFYLKKFSVQEQNRMYSSSKERMAIKSPLLKENMLLDISPLTATVPKEQMENKVIVLIFWNTECPPCTESFASINDFLKQIHNPEGLAILAITTNTAIEVQAKLKESHCFTNS